MKYNLVPDHPFCLSAPCLLPETAMPPRSVQHACDTFAAVNAYLLKSAMCAKSLPAILDRRKRKKNIAKERRPCGALAKAGLMRGAVCHHLPYQHSG